MDKISVYIIAYNQEDKIEASLKSVQWADEIVVADSFSTDRTVLIAKEYGAKVVQISFNGFGDLRNQAIAACSNGWIFSLDSDERCTKEAQEEILSIVLKAGNNSDSPHDLYYVPRKNFFMGQWIRHSGYYPDYRQPQLFKKGTLVFKPDPVHERYEIVSKKGAGYMKSAIHQIPYKNLEEMIEKKNRYSTLGAKKLLLEKEEKSKFSSRDVPKSTMSTALIHGIWSFIRTYLIKLGFLDGWAGFVIALGNFEETFYKYAKFYIADNLNKTNF
ncbi:MAG: glycosyltransferase family 2 protein [Desulfamplus sp.]|nr:glycosyltransferase family 2 protein [Desulfamplus sp.]MBF0242381.1 glycosyltransferase family 2 protein [Desulfamplus sp.]